MHHRLNGHELEQSLGDGEERDYVLQSMGWQRSGHDLATKHSQEHGGANDLHMDLCVTGQYSYNQ